jgi:hypothetical protein
LSGRNRTADASPSANRGTLVHTPDGEDSEHVTTLNKIVERHLLQKLCRI